MEILDSFIRKWFGQWFGRVINLDANVRNLKRKIEELSTKVDDVETELRGAGHHPAKRPRKVVLHWCQNVQKMVDDMPRLEQEVDGLGRWKFVSRALLGKHVEEKMQEVAELQEQHNFPHGVLIDAPPISEQFIPTARFFCESETITARRNKGKYLMDDEVRRINNTTRKWRQCVSSSKKLSDGNHQHWQPLTSVTNQYRQPPPLKTVKVVTTAAHPCQTRAITMSKGSCNCLARTMSEVLHIPTSSSDYTHTSTSQRSSQRPQSQPPLLTPSSSQPTRSLPSSSHPTSGLVTSNSTITTCGQGYVRGIKEWNTGARMDIQFDNSFQPVGDLAASLNGRLGQRVRNGHQHQGPLTYVNYNSADYWSNSTAEEIATQNSRYGELLGSPHMMGQTHFSRIRRQDGYNRQLFEEPESLQTTQHGYFRTYGRDVPRSVVYRHDVGPSLASQASRMAEITQQVWEKLMQEQASLIVKSTQQICDKLKRELRAELTAHIEQMTN